MRIVSSVLSRSLSLVAEWDRHTFWTEVFLDETLAILTIAR